jgi:DNA-binding XRE family transcriptional regulator
VERRQGSEPRRRRLIRLELHKKDGRKASSVLFALNRRLSARNSPSIARFPAIGYTELIKDVRTLQKRSFAFMNIDIGSKIKTLRLSKSMTQEQLAKALHVSAQAVSKWENGVSHS